MDVSRRNFLKYGGVAAATSVLGGGYWLWNDVSKPPYSEINRVVDEFPAKITGAGAIHKYQEPGAKQCVIVIGQIHPKWDALDDGLDAEERTKLVAVNECQNDICQITKELIKLYPIKKVYAEGVTVEHPLPTQKAAKDFYRARLQKLTAFHPEPLKLLENIYQLQSRKRNVQEQIQYLQCIEKFTQFAYIPGGELVLASDGLIDIAPAETYEGYTCGRDNPIGSVNLREDIALELLDDAPVSVIVYGQGHDFKNNVQEWNVKHPQNKRCLVEITPKTILEKKDLFK